jgi:hypothetical protein
MKDYSAGFLWLAGVLALMLVVALVINDPTRVPSGISATTLVTNVTVATLVTSNYPAVVDLEKGYALLTLTNKAAAEMILMKGYRHVIFGNYADYKWPAGTLPFWKNSVFWDPATGEVTEATPAKFILPIYLERIPRN